MQVIPLVLVLSPAVLGLYSYALYPVILAALPRYRPRIPSAADRHPLVTVVIPAYNEEAQIAGAIEAVLAQDYPRESIQLLILSDASTDRTDEIVRGYASAGVELLRMPSRAGKTAAENASFPHIRGDIVVNSDSSVRLHPSAVRLLMSGMADPSVGVVSSRDISVAAEQVAGQSEAGYVGYEMWVRSLETRTGGIVGASGSGYAIRRELHGHPVRDDLSRDFSAALTAHRHGFTAISMEGAFCYVPRTGSIQQEYRRKVRTISRGMETLYHNRELLDLIHHGAFAWKLFSHKVCRWLVPISSIPAVLGLMLLAGQYPLARVALAVAALGATLAALGARWPSDRPLPRWLPAGLVGLLTANLAVIHSAWRFVWGHDDHIWEPTRRVQVAHGMSGSPRA